MTVKPDAFFDLVERLSPGPYLELFARTKRLGWDTWGNEIDSDLEVAVTESRERCEFGCCEWAPDGEVIRYHPHPPECRYCGLDANGVDAMGRPACEQHIEEVADDLGLEAS